MLVKQKISLYININDCHTPPIKLIWLCKNFFFDLYCHCHHYEHHPQHHFLYSMLNSWIKSWNWLETSAFKLSLPLPNHDSPANTANNSVILSIISNFSMHVASRLIFFLSFLFCVFLIIFEPFLPFFFCGLLYLFQFFRLLMVYNVVYHQNQMSQLAVHIFFLLFEYPNHLKIKKTISKMYCAEGVVTIHVHDVHRYINKTKL